MLSPSLFLSERITKKTKIKTKTICKKKRQFLSQLKNLFWISWRTLNSLSALLESLHCVYFVLTFVLMLLVLVESKKNSNKEKRKGVSRIAFSGFVFLHSTKHNNKTMFDSARNLILLLIFMLCGFIDSQTTRICGHIAKCSRKYDHFKLDHLSFLKERRNKYCQFTHTSISTAKCSRCVRDCECYFCFGCWFQQVSLRGVSVQQKLPEKTLLFSVETAPTHVKTRDAIHVCSAATCPQVWFMKLMQKSEDHFPHKQTELTGATN